VWGLIQTFLHNQNVTQPLAQAKYLSNVDTVIKTFNLLTDRLTLFHLESNSYLIDQEVPRHFKETQVSSPSATATTQLSLPQKNHVIFSINLNSIIKSMTMFPRLYLPLSFLAKVCVYASYVPHPSHFIFSY
jgi:hypothetical protein